MVDTINICITNYECIELSIFDLLISGWDDPNPIYIHI